MRLIVVTGGAGFIGSALVWGLNKRGREDIIVVDEKEKMRHVKNLQAVRYAEYIDKDAFIERLKNNRFTTQLEAILHMGACSSTTETDADYLMENNFRYTQRIGAWQAEHKECRFIYASSAATYGNGDNGYAESKQRYDLYAKRQGWLAHSVGLKYFNVFGPNENHKGDMRSVINKAFPGVRDTAKMFLFKSYRDGYGDGEQHRDFIYIKDAVAMTLFFLDASQVQGIFNIGTGCARSWNDVAHALFNAAGVRGTIEYIPMPETLRDKYQYYTCADMRKFYSTGCTHGCMSLEDAVYDYVTNYLQNDNYLGMG
jgi:ADP-L-glycero-D-manno-heptose 6-epimerase